MPERSPIVQQGFLTVPWCSDTTTQLQGHLPGTDPSAVSTTSSLTTLPHCSLYYQVRGNPNGIPVLLMHGGPGYYTVPEDFDVFDPAVYCMVAFDQRGSGQSRPQAFEGQWDAYQTITIEDLVDDAERLRVYLNTNFAPNTPTGNTSCTRGAKKHNQQQPIPAVNEDRFLRWCVAGCSWGSAMALRYAQKYPHHTMSVLLQGVYLGSIAEHAPLFTATTAASAKTTTTLSTTKGCDGVTTNATAVTTTTDIHHEEALRYFAACASTAYTFSARKQRRDERCRNQDHDSCVVRLMPLEPEDTDWWQQDPVLLHEVYRDYIMSFVELQRRWGVDPPPPPPPATSSDTTSTVAPASCTTIEDISERNRRLVVATSTSTSSTQLTTTTTNDNSSSRSHFHLPKDPCMCKEVDEEDVPPQQQRRPCCIERAHRALAIWSLYENWMTYPSDRMYFLNKMRVAVDTSRPYRASHKDITGALMQLVLFPKMMARGGGGGGGATTTTAFWNKTHDLPHQANTPGCSCGATIHTSSNGSKEKTTHALWCPIALCSVPWSRRGVRLWIIHGLQDEVCPTDAAVYLARAVQELTKSVPGRDAAGQTTNTNNGGGKLKNKQGKSNKHKKTTKDGVAAAGVVSLQLVDAAHDAHDDGVVEKALEAAAAAMADHVLEHLF